MPSEQPNKFYLTTPIYYVNARPHIGHAYTTIVADVLARRHRAAGDDTFFLTGTDEHGQKIERSAAAAGVPPQQFTDQVSAQFRSLWDRMGLTYSRYIRTTDECHKRGVQKLFAELYERGFIYLDSYTGSYCVSDEAFVDLPAGTPCPDCGKPLETVTEENFFFELSKFQKPLLDIIESNELLIEPATARNEVISFLKGDFVKLSQEFFKEQGDKVQWDFDSDEYNPNPTSVEWPVAVKAWAKATGRLQVTAKGTEYFVGPAGLKDLSISRSSFTWGIPVPEAVQKASGTQQKHVIYVWLDALANYMTAIGYGSDDAKEQAEFARYWPADLHLVGKEITRFHCVYWPAFLMAAGIATPKRITANGWLLFDNAKMSKSRGNVVRTETILEGFGEHVYAKQFPESTKRERDLFASDVLRYFLLREIPFGQDGSFSFDAMITRYNADLANGYGNLVSRTLAMVEKYFAGVVPEPRFEESEGSPMAADGFDASVLGRAGDALVERLAKLNETDFTTALAEIAGFIAATDGFITANAPWKLAKDEAKKDRLATVLYLCAEAVRWATAALHAYCPSVTAKVWAQLGLGDMAEAERSGELGAMHWAGLKPGTRLGALAPIFPRAEKSLIETMMNMEDTTTTTAPETTTATAAEAAKPAATQPLDEPAGVLPGEAAPVAAGPADASPAISIDDFAKVELRVAQVLVAERIPKADKLLRLEVDLGYEKRQILSGIAEYYAPEDLIGRRIIVITNLAPRKMRGLESHGMLLAASSEENPKPVLATLSEDTPLGLRLK